MSKYLGYCGSLLKEWKREQLDFFCPACSAYLPFICKRS